MAWTAKGNIRGPQGPSGNTGAQGPQGTAGAPGEKWSSGTGSPVGTMSAAVGDWYLNTTNGDVWEQTSSGVWALRGNIRGPTGATGPQGNTGSQGPAGTAGELWFTGSGVPPTATGAIGDWFLRSDTGDYYEKTGSTTWTLRGNLKGPTGAQGIQGPAGADSTVPGPAGQGVPTGGTVGQILHKDSSTNYDTSWKTVPTDQSGLLNPAAVTGASPGKMMGLGVGNQFTPTMSGKVFIAICGYVTCTGAGASAGMQIRWGTGTPPANQAAGTAGTAVGGQAAGYAGGTTANQAWPFCLIAIVSATVGVAMWADLACWMAVSGNVDVVSTTVTIFEIP